MSSTQSRYRGNKASIWDSFLLGLNECNLTAINATVSTKYPQCTVFSPHSFVQMSVLAFKTGA